MPPKCRALPDDSTSTRYGSDSLAASKAEAVHKETNTNPEPEPVHNNTHGTKEDSEESMDEPHNSIEVEVATVVKNQLDLYKIEHQELTKVSQGMKLWLSVSRSKSCRNCSIRRYCDVDMASLKKRP